MRYEDRPGLEDGIARALWDAFSTIKRLDRLVYDDNMELWIAKHSTGASSYYDPEDGRFYSETGNLRFDNEPRAPRSTANGRPRWCD